MNDDVDRLRQKADQCRRLAAAILIKDDISKIRLEALAKEYTSQANELETEIKNAERFRPGQS